MEKEILRKVQLVQLEIANEVKRICYKHSISFFLDSGTLLGAVRHHGFIPWDDDLDLGMKRDQYERFIDIAKTELSSDYILVEWNTSDNYSRPFCKVIKRNTEYVEEGAKESDYFKGIYIDIFPYDIYPDKKDVSQKIIIDLYRAIIRSQCGIRTWVNDGKIIYSKYIKNLPLILLGHILNKDKLKQKYESIAIKHNSENSEYYFPQGISAYGKWIIPHRCLDHYDQLEFEGISFPVPFDYDSYLNHAYGDYMQLPPEDQRENRHKIIKVSFGD